MEKGKLKSRGSAVFSGGCFWCTEAIFRSLRGVSDVMPGYTGGVSSDPDYDEVCTGRTGHAESIKVEFDPAVISYRDLLIVFFNTHDPTTLNRQGGDVGTHYRSAIFYADEEQKRQAESVIRELGDSHSFDKPIVTEIIPLGGFYLAEEYHRDYYEKNPAEPYCQIVIEPKLEKFRKRFAELLNDSVK